MKIKYIPINGSNKYTFGFTQNGKLIWKSSEVFNDAFEAAKSASKFFSKNNL